MGWNLYIYIYIYINKSEDHKLQQNTYSVQKSRHLIKFMFIILPDGYVLDLIGPFNGIDNDAKIAKVNRLSYRHYILYHEKILLGFKY